MHMTRSLLHSKVMEFCTKIGRDPLLVQGAGGNVSYKHDGELWIKASGKWLADADKIDIFVPVDLNSLKDAIGRNEFEEAPRLTQPSSSRASIETMLHALMPHRIVTHVHAIEALVHLVSDDCEARLAERLGDFRDWVLVDYHKPGAPLATAVSRKLAEARDASVVFLQNHGVVVGGHTTDEVSALLGLLTARLHSPVRQAAAIPVDKRAQELRELGGGYRRLQDSELEQLVFDEESYSRLSHSWALYPDHVVFLGPHALAYDSLQKSELLQPIENGRTYPIFIKGAGIFITEAFNRAAHEQLRCYYDVVRRLPMGVQTRTLTVTDIAGLLNWDAERYRIENAK
ncbi:class II aldolase/adducin family protein [Achromobacter denitrificans]|uniref:class II aldolase/adducin family protein n=1 Tax=Achromobacter denitrificans TaxID=32002 RepID=UPI0014659FBF|nr:class II aldolase/adducin family protein [Achromobacter denitrificans]CAB3829830.1 hypothetical protein LMG1860_01753 [Achromobacter denitrificans]